MAHLPCSPHKQHQLNRNPQQVCDSPPSNLWPALKAVRTDRFLCLDYFPFLHPGVFPHVPKQPQSGGSFNYTIIIPKTDRNFSQGIHMKQNFCLHGCLKIIHPHTDAQDHDGDKLWGAVTSFEQFLAGMIQILHTLSMPHSHWGMKSLPLACTSLKQAQVTKLKQLQHENPLLKVFIALDKISSFRIQLHEFWQTADTWMEI